MEEALARGVQLFVALSVGYLVASWFVLSVWAYRDINTRSQSVVTQVLGTLLVVLFWLPGALLYLLLRPKDTLDEVYQRSLEEEYLISDLEEVPVCHSCQRQVDEDYVICPHCHVSLKEACPVCTKLVNPQWELCPYCGTSRADRSAMIREQLPQTEDRFLDRGETGFRPLRPASITQLQVGESSEIKAGAVTPQLSADKADVGSGEDEIAGEDQPIRLFDRKLTQERNSADVSNREPEAASSNGHVAASDVDVDSKADDRGPYDPEPTGSEGKYADDDGSGPRHGKDERYASESTTGEDPAESANESNESVEARG